MRNRQTKINGHTITGDPEAINALNEWMDAVSDENLRAYSQGQKDFATALHNMQLPEWLNAKLTKEIKRLDALLQR